MLVLQFLRKESTISPWPLAVIASVSGMANALILAMINSGAAAAEDLETNSRTFVLFMLALAIYIVSQRYLLATSSVQVEVIVNRIRRRIADKIRRADLLPLEGIDREVIYAGVTRETQTISQAAPQITIAMQAAVLVLFAVFYLAYLSKTAFFLTVALTLIAVLIHFKKTAELNRNLQAANETENDFNGALSHLLDGFKEVRMSESRSDDLHGHLGRISRKISRLRTMVGTRFAWLFVFAQSTFYILMATVVFVLPRISETHTQTVSEATATILFIIGPLSNFIAIIPAFANASVAAESIVQLEKALDEVQEASLHRTDLPRESLEFNHRIDFENVVFSYQDPNGKPSFTLGPVDLNIQRGEVVFIVGGNGSGKSTFLKLLTSLYFPMSGNIRVDGRSLEEISLPDYRKLYSVIFSDFHLFDRLYGLDEVDDDRVNELLRMMELDEKTSWQGRRFENQDLSTGQRKRLALLSSLLEDKPIYVFDEWAADQDPHFRKFFYETILKDMQKQGKTIIAATHDDHYFHVADRVLKMEYGRFIPFEKLF